MYEEWDEMRCEEIELQELVIPVDDLEGQGHLMLRGVLTAVLWLSWNIERGLVILPPTGNEDTMVTYPTPFSHKHTLTLAKSLVINSSIMVMILWLISLQWLPISYKWYKKMTRLLEIFPNLLSLIKLKKKNTFLRSQSLSKVSFDIWYKQHDCL